MSWKKRFFDKNSLKFSIITSGTLQLFKSWSKSSNFNSQRAIGSSWFPALRHKLFWMTKYVLKHLFFQKTGFSSCNFFLKLPFEIKRRPENSVKSLFAPISGAENGDQVNVGFMRHEIPYWKFSLSIFWMNFLHYVSGATLMHHKAINLPVNFESEDKKMWQIERLAWGI